MRDRQLAGSLCSVSDLTITSKNRSEEVGHTFSFDHHGNITSQQPSHIAQGTVMVACNLFKHLPVRRQIYNAVKKKKEELKKIEELLYAYGIIHPGARIILRHNKEIVWQKTGVPDTRAALSLVLGRSVVQLMEQHSVQDKDTNICVECFLPLSDSDVMATSRATNDRSFLAVNNRPVVLKELEKVLKQYYNHERSSESRHPVYFLHLKLSTSDLDINVDPNKTRVFLHCQAEVLKLLTGIFEKIYGPLQQDKPDKNKTKETFNDNLEHSTISNDSESSFDTSLENMQTKDVQNLRLSESRVSKPFCRSVRVEIHEPEDINTVDNRQCSDAKNADVIDKSLSSGSDLDTLENVLHREQNCNTLCKKNTSENINSLDKDLDFSNSVGKHVSPELEVINSHHQDDNKENDASETQNSNMTFDILDDDFNEILKTQSSTLSLDETQNTELNDTDLLLGDISLIGELAKGDNSLKDGGVSAVQDNSSNIKTEGVETRMLDWSKGVSETTGNGELIQPVRLLTANDCHGNKKRQLSLNEDSMLVTPPAKKKISYMADQPSLYEVVGNSPLAGKDRLGYLTFAKEVRPQLVEKHPSASFDKISTMVRSKWAELSEEERQTYETQGNSQMAELKKRVAAGKKLANKMDRRIQPVKGMPSIKDQLLSSHKKPEEPIKSVSVPFSLHHLRGRYKSGLRLTQPHSTANKRRKLIGPLKYYHGWVCIHGNLIQLVNPHRFEETVLHRELMENHIIPVSKLENPMGLTESSVGGEQLFQTLVKMIPPQTSHTYSYIDDIRLKANGFEVRCHQDGESRPVLELVSMATCMPTYGVPDLKEVLDLITNTGASSLYQARPLKVIYYLQGEAVRMVRQRPVHRTRDEVEETLDQMSSLLPSDCSTCLHNKPLFHTVYDLETVQSTQLTQSQT
ncbi:PMS1 protein homolog 1-like [Mya arenaria]|uniref:PMS1 protein homolog 1-like n=1 Tax=Mya arenaria TaxID=6604 RepID=UPI0022DF99A0|nr:PMS1 protein homolog 1-like [Mya arenaria]